MWYDWDRIEPDNASGGGVAMVVGVGVDVVAVDDIRRAVERQGEAFVERVLAPPERGVCAPGDAGSLGPVRLERIAARFAAKEAAMKALGTGWGKGVSFHDIEVSGGGGERPAVELRGGALAAAQALRVTRLHLSMTHSAGVAVAVVILEGADADAS